MKPIIVVADAVVVVAVVADVVAVLKRTKVMTSFDVYVNHDPTAERVSKPRLEIHEKYHLEE